MKIRLDKFLVLKNPEKSRAFVQKLIESGQVLVNGKMVSKPGLLVDNNDEVSVNLPKLRKISAGPEKMKLKILYEDKDIIVIDKCAGMVVHPSESGSHSSGTLVNAVLYHCGKGLSGISGELRPGIVHRLDKNTSGVMVVAKNDLAHQFLMKQFSEREVEKKYIVLVNGVVEPSCGVIDSPIGRSLRNRKKMAITSEDKGRKAVTEYKLQEVLKDSFGAYSLLDVWLKTGRTHQIRVHMNAIGYPVVGDIVYGQEKVNKHFSDAYGLGRQFLHAKELCIVHPRSGEKMKFESGLPRDLVKVLKLLKKAVL